MSASRQIAINFDVIFQLAFSPYYKYNQEFSVFFLDWENNNIATMFGRKYHSDNTTHI